MKISRIFSLGCILIFGYAVRMWVAVIYLWAINGLTLLVFGWDKHLAKRRKRRVAERTLLWLAAVGGSPGAVLGRMMFRHKTRKRGFTIWLSGIAGAQAIILYLAVTGKFSGPF